MGRPVKLSEAIEHLGNIFLGDACTSVTDVNDKAFLVLVVARFDSDLALCCELERVFDQINHHLLEPSNVTHDCR